MAYGPLTRAAALPESSILPQQAMIFMNARMHLPLQAQWWDSIIGQLAAAKPDVQDVSSLSALAQCARERSCNLPKERMVAAFEAAIAHPGPNARLLAIYSDYAWNVLDDHQLGEKLALGAVQAEPGEPAYHVTLARMYIAQGSYDGARKQLSELQKLNIGGDLSAAISELDSLMPSPK